MYYALEPSNKLVDNFRTHSDILNRELFYSKMKKYGYHKTDKLCEYPYWVANLKRLNLDIRLLVFDSIKDILHILNNNVEGFFIYPIEATKNIISDILNPIYESYNIPIYSNTLLSYTKSFNTLEEIAEYFGITIGPSNEAVVGFTDYNNRYYSTKGCNNNCKFCLNCEKTKLLDIPERLFAYNNKPIYLGNLSAFDIGIEEFTPFSGNSFIIQTTVKNVLKNKDIIQYLQDKLNVIEIGAEVLNDEWLKSMNKNYTIEELDNALWFLAKLNIPVVLNLMIGIDNKTGISIKNIYEDSKTVLQHYINNNLVKAFNIFNYSDYNSTYQDSNESIFHKSWITSETLKYHLAYADFVYKENAHLLMKL